MTLLQRWCSLFIIALAFLVRVWALDFKPAHFDEGVNGWMVDGMRIQGCYEYDPANYHGPLHFYVLFASQTLFGRSLWALRMPTVLVGTAAVAVLLLFRRFFSFQAVAYAAAFLAISPGMVFYSRYAIHEMWLPLFALLACYGGFGIARGERKASDLWCLSLGLGGMVLTKETYAIHFIAAAIAWSIVSLTGRRHEAAGRRRSRPADLFAGPGAGAPADENGHPAPPRERYAARDLVRVCGVTSAVIIAFYAGFGFHWDGVAGLFTTFGSMHTKVTNGEEGHNKEVMYWLKLMAHYEWPALAGVLAAPWIAFRRSVRFGSLLAGAGLIAAAICIFIAHALTTPEPTGFIAALQEPMLKSVGNSQANPALAALWQSLEPQHDFIRPAFALSVAGAIAVVCAFVGLSLMLAHPARDPLVRWLALYGLGSLAAYSLIPYKTPWCIINVLWPFCLVTGIVLKRLRAPTNAFMVGLVALLLAVPSALETRQLNFIQPTDDRLPAISFIGPDGIEYEQRDGTRYAYVQTTFDINKLLIPIRQLVAESPLHRQMTGRVIGESFPLIWELNDFPNVRFSSVDDSPLENYDADFLLIPDSRMPEIEARLRGIYFKERFVTRDGGLDSTLYLFAERFARVLPADRRPEFHPRIPQALDDGTAPQPRDDSPAPRESKRP